MLQHACVDILLCNCQCISALRRVHPPPPSHTHICVCTYIFTLTSVPKLAPSHSVSAAASGSPNLLWPFSGWVMWASLAQPGTLRELECVNVLQPPLLPTLGWQRYSRNKLTAAGVQCIPRHALTEWHIFMWPVQLLQGRAASEV